MAWHFNNLTTTTGAPSAGVGVLRLRGYAFQETQHVIYASDADGHIRELLWDSDAGMIMAT